MTLDGRGTGTYGEGESYLDGFGPFVRMAHVTID